MSDKCVIILSEKSSGSSACQNLLAKFANIQNVTSTRHYENETLYWTKAASILDKPQIQMVDSEVPIPRDKAQANLISLLQENIKDFVTPEDDKTLIMEGWRLLCRQYTPIFLEKSPHHLCQWSALELIVECMEKFEGEIDFLLIGLVRNPLDTLYSQYTRWKSPPEKVQQQWLTAYQNLLKLQDIAGDRLVIVRYEDIVTSPEYLQKVFDFCGVSLGAADKTYLHAKAIHKWKSDNWFGFSLSEEVIELAEQFGYQRDELTNDTYLLWPLVRNVSRTINKIVQPLKMSAVQSKRSIKSLFGA